MENSKSELDVKKLKVKGKDEFKANTVNGLPIAEISNFTDELIRTTIYFLPEKDQMDIKNHLYPLRNANLKFCCCTDGWIGGRTLWTGDKIDHNFI